MSDSPDLPVAAVEAKLQVFIYTGPNEKNVIDVRVVKDSKEQIKKNCHYDEMQVMNELVRKSDAEEAIKEARRQERKEILEKIKDKITRWSERIESHEDVPSPLKIRKSVLEELRDDLEGENLE